jgi:hypothetical protein
MQLLEECARVTANPSLNVGILKQHVTGLGEQLAEQSRLSGAPRSCYHHRGKMPGRHLEGSSQFSSDISHVNFLKYNLRIINTSNCVYFLMLRNKRLPFHREK